MQISIFCTTRLLYFKFPISFAARSVSVFISQVIKCRRTNAGDFKILDGGYACPQCHSLVSECPRRCGTCGLMLVCSSHLAKSFRQMFPLSPFQEMKIQYDEQLHCSACNILFPKVDKVNENSCICFVWSFGLLALLIIIFLCVCVCGCTDSPSLQVP